MDRIIRPTTTFRGIELDMRVSPNFGVELRDEIIRMVDRDQKFLVHELPNILVLSHRQFVSLLDYTEEMYQTEDRLFQTPLNVMEVVVDDTYDVVSENDIIITSEFDNFGEGVTFDEGTT